VRSFCDRARTGRGSRPRRARRAQGRRLLPALPRLARFLADHPQRTYPAGHATRPDDVPITPYADLAAQCGEFVEATGEAGDVYLLHPHILHAKAQNVLRRPRFITNPPLTLVEWAVLRRRLAA
jgi:hypothetical protein